MTVVSWGVFAGRGVMNSGEGETSVREIAEIVVAAVGQQTTQIVYTGRAAAGPVMFRSLATTRRSSASLARRPLYLDRSHPEAVRLI
jgi:nucleoside-diphosphate-sugar epimerase